MIKWPPESALLPLCRQGSQKTAGISISSKTGDLHLSQSPQALCSLSGKQQTQEIHLQDECLSSPRRLRTGVSHSSAEQVGRIPSLGLHCSQCSSAQPPGHPNTTEQSQPVLCREVQIYSVQRGSRRGARPDPKIAQTSLKLQSLWDRSYQLSYQGQVLGHSWLLSAVSENHTRKSALLQRLRNRIIFTYLIFFF